MVANTPNTFKNTRYGSWHLWTVLDRGPDFLWPLIYSLWKTKPPKLKKEAKYLLPVKKAKSVKKSALEDAFGENWNAEDSGGGIADDMRMRLGAAVKYWEFEVKQLPDRAQARIFEKLSTDQKDLIKSVKKFYPIWI